MAVARTLPQQVQKNKDDIQSVLASQSIVVLEVQELNGRVELVEVAVINKQDKSPTDGVTYALKNGSLTPLIAIMQYKGSVPSYANLPTSGQQIGDVYNVSDTGKIYAWPGTAWDDLGGTVNLDNYYTKSQIESFLLDKLNRIYGATTYPRAYINQASGTPAMLDISATAVGLSIGQRNELGQLSVADGTASHHAVNKDQLDLKLNQVSLVTGASQAYVKSADGSQRMVSIGASANSDTIVLRSTGGRAKIGDPVDPTDIANKQWVENIVSSTLFNSLGGSS